MKHFNQWFSNFLRKRKIKQQRHKAQNDQKEANQIVQIMEYKGKMYLSYNGIPLIKISHLDNPIQVLTEARITRVNFLNEYGR